MLSRNIYDPVTIQQQAHGERAAIGLAIPDHPGVRWNCREIADTTGYPRGNTMKLFALLTTSLLGIPCAVPPTNFHPSRRFESEGFNGREWDEIYHEALPVEWTDRGDDWVGVFSSRGATASETYLAGEAAPAGITCLFPRQSEGTLVVMTVRSHNTTGYQR